ncbi:unnamed protein product [Lactuca virosa]|uniref:Uncharacterized protein n=1 Tax=Lactuca virosa TaxID=75947 RepID=A0AAU9N463_9ASTR|nr:unnamed protein product [Lactuca virosa]
MVIVLRLGDHGDGIQIGDHGDDIQMGEGDGIDTGDHGDGIETGDHGDDIQTGDVNDVIVEDGHIVEEVEVVDVGKEDVLLPRVGLESHKVLDEVEQRLDEILGEDKVKLDVEQIALMLEAGYSMEEIEDVLDHPSDNDDDAIIDDVDGIVDDAIIEVDGGGEQEEGGDDGHLGDDEGEQEERGDDEGPDDVPRVTKLRKPSERIILQKLKKTVFYKKWRWFIC